MSDEAFSLEDLFEDEQTEATTEPVKEELDPTFGQGEPSPDLQLDSNFGQGEPEDTNELEDFLNNDVVYEEVSTIGKDVDYKVPEELKSNYRVGCAGSMEMIERMMNNVTGIKIVGTYFNLRADRHDSASPISTNLSGSEQAYDMIKNAIINVSDTINDYDLTQVSLDGIIYIGITPRLNDYFSFVDQNGKLLFFNIKEIERVNYGSREIHRIKLNYAFNEVTNDGRIKDLMDKVVDVLVYDNNAKMIGEASLLTSDDYEGKVDLNNEIKRMKEYYINMFVAEDGVINLYAKKRRAGFEEIPEKMFFDKLVNKFFQSLCEFNDTKFFNLYSPKYEMENDGIDIFRGLRETISITPNDLHRFYGAYYRGRHFGDPFLGDILTFRREEVYVNNYYVYDDYEQLPYYPLLMFRENEDNKIEYPLINKRLEDKSYIFSSNFYDGDLTKMNKFEKIIANALKKVYPNYSEIIPYVKNYRKWSVYEKYYIIPILIYICMKICKTMSYK